MLNDEDRQRLRNVLKELGTEETWYGTTGREHAYQEQAFLNLCRVVERNDDNDPSTDFGVPPALNGPKTSMPHRESGRQGCSVRVLQALQPERDIRAAYETAPWQKSLTSVE